MIVPTTALAIRSEADVAAASLDARAFARECGLTRIDVAKVTTVVSELANNIVKYADHGRITLRHVTRDDRSGVEVEARDSGPGIASLEDALADHHSTGGTLGLGLPGARRLMDTFEITSTLGSGTTVRACKWLT